jgi:pimeloyl-ACP methyl ester carboxylesterase
VDASHFLIEDRPDELAEEIISFLEGTAGAG